MNKIKFGSVCSGIEAASVAWHPLGWEAVWLSEIEPFPSAVLAHHYPTVPNLGDMTTLPERILSGEVEAPDVFCGGTPCQAFSVAGLRNSLDDARGNLSLTFVGIANAIDHVRSVRRDRPAIIFWENVPGVLSTKDNAFGCFLAGIAGEDNPLEPPRGKWTNSGYVLGPKRAVAWRVLDAQYFGVAQRRRRVFVVASARDDFDPTAVLFEFDGVRRDTAPSREAGKTIAPCVTNGPPFSRTGNERVEVEAMVVHPVCGQNGKDIAGTITAGFGGSKMGAPEVDAGLYIPIALQDVTPREKAQNGRGWNDDGTAYTVDTHATQGVAQPIAFSHYRTNASHGEMCPTLQVSKGGGAAGAAVAQPMAYNIAPGKGELKDDIHVTDAKISKTIDASGSNPSMHQGGAAIVQTMAVRRLTPVECERLQGFPDGYTNIPWRKKDESPDGPRYKALGNSWAVPNVRWIGQRIQKELEKNDL
jgi:DNA (cytosine-5)-methyltransferase 1